ncbi:MAG: histidinol dehydrogenase [Steroidobacteraceae bacterium]
MQILDWQSLDSTARAAALGRPREELRAEVVAQSTQIIAAVRAEGDAAVRRYTQQFNQVELDELRVSKAEIAAARSQLSAEQIAAIDRAILNVRRFHEPQLPAVLDMEIEPGVRCGRVVRAIPAVGLYVPAGSAPLPSTLIMLAIPAQIAGCPVRVVCTSPGPDGRANAAVLVASELCGIDTVFRIGGVQAIAALAYGTQSVPKVDKIFGPGSAWVTAAKQLVAADAGGAANDMPAGPSEVLVIADDSARPDFVAADLLAQAEHDPRSQAILVTTSRELARATEAVLQKRAAELSRSAILAESLQHCRCILVADLATAASVSNDYAPEHLIIQTRAPRALLDAIVNAGSVFLGAWSPEPMGDYCSGTNHVLPTYGYARAYSGLSVHDFTKRMTVQEFTAAGLRGLGPTAVTLARLEGLDAHAHAVQLRLDVLESQS